MQYYSTNNKSLKTNLKSAVLHSLAPDNGLYMPEVIGKLSDDFLFNIEYYSFHEIAYLVSKNLIGNSIPEVDLKAIIEDAFDFPAPVVMLDDHLAALELWHGPSQAFKDFGAGFMASLISYYIKNEDKKYTILVATSGDTGGAVAAGFYKKPGVDVVILYPSGKVSDLQEKQLTTLGENITALEINGSFDDCQALVKRAFLDQDLNKKLNLSSANSINIARLIPQSFYYFEAYKQVKHLKKEVVVSVPSGNFGNLTAGVMAKKMGLPILKFLAATNANHIVPDYIANGTFAPKASIPTISNAMDVGNPSNFVRLLEIFNHDVEAFRAEISGYWLNDDDTRSAMKYAFEKYGYICDPHGAIAFSSLLDLNQHQLGIFLETAHPAKFLETVEETIQHTVPLPKTLASLLGKRKVSEVMDVDFDEFKVYLMNR